MSSSALSESARATLGQSGRSPGPVRVMVTIAPAAASWSRTSMAIARLTSGSQSPVGPQAPRGGCPGSITSRRPASGRAGSIDGGCRNSKTRSVPSIRERHPHNCRSNVSDIVSRSSASCFQVSKWTKCSSATYRVQLALVTVLKSEMVSPFSDSSTVDGTGCVNGIRSCVPSLVGMSVSEPITERRASSTAGARWTSASCTQAMASRDNRNRT